MLRAVAVFLVLLVGASAAADDAAVIRGKVKQWLADLESDAFEVRETARTELRKHGNKARDLLEAAKDHADPEVRRTVRAILARVGSTRPVVSNAQVVDGSFDNVHPVSLDLENVKLEDALKALGEQIGARFRTPPSARIKKVSVKAKDMPPYAVLRDLIKQGGVRMAAPFDRAGRTSLVLADDSPVPPWTAAGPIMVEVLEVTSVRSLKAKTPTRYVLSMRMQWIPLVQIAQYRTPRVEKAVDAAGNRFVPGPHMARQVGYGVGTTRRYADLQVHVTPTSGKCGDALASIDLVLPITSFQHDVARVVLDDVGRIPICLDRAGKEADPGTNETVSFESLAESADRPGQWVADLAATLPSEVAQRTVQALLTQEDGRVHALYVAGGRSRSEDGTVRLTARVYGLGSSSPKSLHVAWFQRRDTGSIRVRLTDVPLR